MVVLSEDADADIMRWFRRLRRGHQQIVFSAGSFIFIAFSLWCVISRRDGHQSTATVTLTPLTPSEDDPAIKNGKQVYPIPNDNFDSTEKNV